MGVVEKTFLGGTEAIVLVVVAVVVVAVVGVVKERVLVGFEARFGVVVRCCWEGMDAKDKEEIAVAEAAIGERLWEEELRGVGESINERDSIDALDPQNQTQQPYPGLNVSLHCRKWFTHTGMESPLKHLFQLQNIFIDKIQ